MIDSSDMPPAQKVEAQRKFPAGPSFSHDLKKESLLLHASQCEMLLCIMGHTVIIIRGILL